MSTATADVRGRLGDPGLPDRLAALGFREADARDLRRVLDDAVRDPDALDAVTGMADRLVARIGQLGGDARDAWPDRLRPAHVAPSRPDPYGVGVLPMLALLVTAPEVAAHHRRRGVSDDVSAATLADLGQQAWVHRSTYGELGLETSWWLAYAWSGSLYSLGRLQYNLEREGDRWVLSTHVPATGPLTPTSVDASLAAARTFFATHFPDHPVGDVVCRSWLLDPRLPDLVPGSNLAAFARRWAPYGQAGPGEEDVLFFVFGRRGRVDLSTLPADTTLRRAVLDVLRSGHWSVASGRLVR